MKITGNIVFDLKDFEGFPVYYNHNYKMAPIGIVRDGEVELYVDPKSNLISDKLEEGIREGKYGLTVAGSFGSGRHDLTLREVSIVHIQALPKGSELKVVDDR